MILITGGAFQGKLEFARTLKQDPVVAGGKDAGEEMLRQADVITGFHLYIRRLLLKGADPCEAVRGLASFQPDVILIMDQLGCGVVPMDPFDRKYRETAGRIGCELARAAEQVWLVNCGIGRRLK